MSSYKVPALEKTIAILNLLEQSPDGLTATEFYKELKLPKTSVFSILSVLEENEFVKKKANGKYILGVRLFHLGMSYLENLDLVKVSRPYLQQLMRDTGYTIHLGVMDKDEVVYVDKVEANTFVQFSTYPGKRLEFHTCGIGKAIAAYYDRKSLNELLSNDLKSYTPATITKPDELLKEFEKVRNNGFALEDEEGEPGIRCIGVPIFGKDGNVIAGISLTALTVHLTDKLVDDIAGQVIKTGKKISNEFGGSYQLEKIKG
ncbi:IclR family transcriptional regulator [Thalassobacillus devorans]|uniref:IclR family transcriptional regulator n=1 Tax=Thalassobacillus devorans TaxID=279813 RepID=A0ABQ1P2Q1_9BACI|nr:IclR family transcriptional regulator [Thalassobacillus devorans]NIK28012.1 DNA-binding IclR family transcriptional regulator [Thalassobacillus devorans]GGC89608.1 IclR family transcriptional regulator [Thalassobacillus devorans]